MTGCPPEPGPEPDPGSGPGDITYTVAQSGGANNTDDTTGIVFTFSKSVDSLGLSAADITVTKGAGEITTATLSGSGTKLTLGVTAVTTPGDITVKITKSGIEAAIKTVIVHKQGQTIPGTLEYELISSGTNANTYRVRKGTVTTGAVIIPAIYNDLPVTEIGGYAFQSSSITSITIPEGVTSIGNAAFNYCTSLASVNIPDSVTSIGSGAFNGCTSLTSVTIPDSVTSIGNSAFRDCTSLASVNIPDSVTSIGNYVFDECRRLTSVTIPNSVTSIGNNAFQYCTRLTSVTIPNSVTSIGNGAFFYCRSLTSITIPNSVTSIGNSAFSVCDSLTSITVDANNPNYTSEGGILYNKNKTTLIRAPGGISGNVTIPNSVTSIGNSAFDYCTSLTSITIPNSVTSIGSYAFEDCTGLASVTIPASVTSISDRAFYYCTSLTSVTFAGTIASGSFSSWYPFPGDLRDKFYATNTTNGMAGTYTTTAPTSNSSVWTKR